MKKQNKKLTEGISKLKRKINAINPELKRLNNELKRITKKIEEEKLFKNKKGFLSWPVSGKVVTFFGKQKHSSLSTYKISKGIEIETEQFANVKAVEKGKVVFKSPFKNYGNIVIISHPGSFFTVYGHLARILVKKDGKVNSGEIVGQCGAKPLYFEIRKGEKALNPIKWLKKKNRR